MKHVIVIGGGAAGCMAAVAAAQKGAAVTLLERNPKLGRKLYITGKGRCNVTNNCSVEEVVASCRMSHATAGSSPAPSPAFPRRR